jgi:hypothetical protein
MHVGMTVTNGLCVRANPARHRGEPVRLAAVAQEYGIVEVVYQRPIVAGEQGFDHGRSEGKRLTIHKDHIEVVAAEQETEPCDGLAKERPQLGAVHSLAVHELKERGVEKRRNRHREAGALERRHELADPEPAPGSLLRYRSQHQQTNGPIHGRSPYALHPKSPVGEINVCVRLARDNQPVRSRSS